MPLILTAASFIRSVTAVVVSVTPPGGVNTAAVGALPVVYWVTGWPAEEREHTHGLV